MIWCRFAAARGLGRPPCEPPTELLDGVAGPAKLNLTLLGLATHSSEKRTCWLALQEGWLQAGWRCRQAGSCWYERSGVGRAEGLCRFLGGALGSWRSAWYLFGTCPTRVRLVLPRFVSSGC